MTQAFFDDLNPGDVVVVVRKSSNTTTVGTFDNFTYRAGRWYLVMFRSGRCIAHWTRLVSGVYRVTKGSKA